MPQPRIEWYRFCKIFMFLILTGILSVHTKESDKIQMSGKPDIHGTSGDVQHGIHNKLSREAPRQQSPSSPSNDQWKAGECVEDQPDTDCSETGGNCLNCDWQTAAKDCKYGENVTLICEAKPGVTCKTDKTGKVFKMVAVCQYCYQTSPELQSCNGSTCTSHVAPRQLFRATCEVHPSVICFGNRKFQRMMPCNLKNGYRWSRAFILSITLGGFGADRFYLGRWQEGIGKLFSFGGLGLWTIIDIILIGVRYLGPADGSLYVD